MFYKDCVCGEKRLHVTICCMRKLLRSITLVVIGATGIVLLVACAGRKKLLPAAENPIIPVPRAIAPQTTTVPQAWPDGSAWVAESPASWTAGVPDVPSVTVVSTELAEDGSAATGSAGYAPESSATVSSGGFPMETPEPTPFSIVWISDTQSMAYCHYTDALESMGRWIVDEREEQNILYVVQTGDAVENGFSDWQWKNYDTCYDQFKGVLPYFGIAGNHETGMKRHSYEGYLARPNVSSIPRRNSFERGRAAYATFRAGGTDFLILGAGWDSELMAVDWMNDVLKTHPNFVAILLFHGYIQTNGTYTVVGKKMFEQVVKPNPNVRLVLCGHVLGTSVRFEDVDDNGDGAADRRVTALMYNYQDAGMDCGQLRLLTFSPVQRSLRVLTYSPYHKRYYRDYTYSSSDFLLVNVF